MQQFWNQLGRSARAGLVIGILVIAALTAAAGYWLLRTDYQVLFGDLAPQDAAAMVAELERLKVPYTLGADGTSILVDHDQVYKTRMKLMGKELPLRGAVGFELFSNSDFGMTEFSQKINYQRALQGELTRTILSLTQIKDARVILVMPEQGLFKQASSKAKASITVALKSGQTLRAEQVSGIQRLVAASVPGIGTQDVTILDQNGVALSRDAGLEGEGDAGTGRLDLKKETENYLSRKASDVLERTFGAGQAMASVDVVLNVERAQITTEDLVVPPARTGRAPTGVVVRERETVRDAGGTGLELRTGEGSGTPRSASTQRDVEYAVGRRVEQIVSQPGSIRRLQAVAVVRRPLSAIQQEQIRRVLAAAVGASFERGDTVVIHTLDLAAIGNSDATGLTEPAATAGQALADKRSALRTRPVGPLSAGGLGDNWLLAGGLLAICGTGGVLWLKRRRARADALRLLDVPLTERQRQAALLKIQSWLADDVAPTSPRDGS